MRRGLFLSIFVAAVIAGVIALMKSVNPNLTPQDVRRIIVDTAFMREGFRVLDAEAAVRAALE